MTAARIIAGVGAALLGASAAGAAAPGEHSLTLRNATGGRIDCTMHRDGTSVLDIIPLKAGQSSTQSYRDDKHRWLRCDGAYSDWQRLALDGRYDLTGNGARRVVAVPAAP